MGGPLSVIDYRSRRDMVLGLRKGVGRVVSEVLVRSTDRT